MRANFTAAAVQHEIEYLDASGNAERFVKRAHAEAEAELIVLLELATSPGTPRRRIHPSHEASGGRHRNPRRRVRRAARHAERHET
jgi:predicted amidohydrolase